MLLDGEQKFVVTARNRVLEDLLVGKEPQTLNDVEDGRNREQVQEALDERGVVHGWLLVRVGHPPLLTEVVDDEADQGDWEE